MGGGGGLLDPLPRGRENPGLARAAARGTTRENAGAMNKHRICVLGGTGFIGHRLLQSLARQGHALRVLTRRRERHRDLLVLPTLELVEANVHYVSELSQHFKDCDTVINLTGILNPGSGPNSTFQAVHAELPAKIAEACRFNGIRRLLHMSALGADREGPSEYLRSKAAGEEALTAAAREGLAVTVFRPSVVFGPEDDFFNRFAALVKVAPVLPLAMPEARFAPVYVGDVATAFVLALEDRGTHGQVYELCGPGVYTLRELVEYVARKLGRRRWIVGLGEGGARLQARVLARMPGQLLTPDNLQSMSVDSVCTDNGLESLGIHPTSLEAVAPAYLARTGRESYYQSLRVLAGRS